MNPISSASVGSSSQQTRSWLVQEGEGSRPRKEQVTDIEDYSDSCQSSESEASEEHVLLTDHNRKVGKYKKNLQATKATVLALEREVITTQLDASKGKDIDTKYDATIQDYVTTTDTDSVRIHKKSPSPWRRAEKLQQKLTATEEENAALNKALEAKDEELRLFKSQKNENQEQKLRSKKQGNLINSAHSPLKRINIYFDSLKNHNLIKQTLLQLVTGIVLINKKAGKPLSHLPDCDALEIHKLLEIVGAWSGGYRNTEIDRLDLSEHYRKIQACLQDIGMESDIDYINEEILTAIRGQFDSDKRGNIVVQLDDAIGSLGLDSEDYLQNKHKHNAACTIEIALIGCFSALGNTREMPASFPLMHAACTAQDKKKLIGNLRALYQKYDGLQIRNTIDSSLGRINSYFDSLVKLHPLKQAILHVFTGIVLHSKKVGESLSDLANQEIGELYKLISDSLYYMDWIDRNPKRGEINGWSFSKHYEKIKACLEQIGPESDIQFISANISSEIEKQFNIDKIWQLRSDIRELIQKVPRFALNEHEHNSDCEMDTSDAFGGCLAFFSSHYSILCTQQEIENLSVKFSSLYKKYSNLKQRQTIRFQTRADSEIANQEEQPSSSRDEEVPEHLESAAASSNTPLLGQKTAIIFKYI